MPLAFEVGEESGPYVAILGFLPAPTVPCLCLIPEPKLSSRVLKWVVSLDIGRF